jgi:hypothetical protein
MSCSLQLDQTTYITGRAVEGERRGHHTAR